MKTTAAGIAGAPPGAGEASAGKAGTGTRRRPRKRRFSDPGRTWAKTLERYRPGLVSFVLDELAGLYGRPTWQRQRFRDAPA